MICAWMVIGMMMMMTFLMQRVGIIDDIFDANSTNETFILSDGPTPDQAG